VQGTQSQEQRGRRKQRRTSEIADADRVHRRVKMKIVVHVPHASIEIPEAYREPFLLSGEELLREATLSADLHTDTLARQAWPQASIVASSVSRIVCDVERYSDDVKEPMAARGRGMIYTATHEGKPLRRQLSAVERTTIQREVYDPHWEKLRAAAVGGLLVDLHSYPAARWPVETVSSEAVRPEIDLGTDPELTPASWRDALVGHFEKLGFETAINTPYAGVIDAGARVAVMIEIRRDVLGKPSDHARWSRVVRALAGLPLPR
jgi:N-formylglutamate amidohydrolase